MIAKRTIPGHFHEWNSRWGSPYGRRRSVIGHLLPKTRLGIRGKGPFAFQPNNTTRRFEFPWAFYEINALGRNLSIAEIGGGMSGLQFVLAHEGHRVINIDPGMAAAGKGWDVNEAMHSRIGQALSSPVALRPTTIGKAEIPSNSVDVVLSVSVLEHLTPADIDEVVEHVPRILKPGGSLVLTVDLFLDLHPFTRKSQNVYGTNMRVGELVEKLGFLLVQGTRSELFGFSDFDASATLENLADYLIGERYPVLTQCLVARKPVAAGSQASSDNRSSIDSAMASGLACRDAALAPASASRETSVSRN